MKCDKCGYSDNGSGDWAHICGPVEVKKTGMNPRLRQFEKESKLEIFGLGAKRIPWEAALEKYAELIVRECMRKIMIRKEEAIDNDWRVDEAMSAALSDISEHFGVEQ